MRCKPKIQQLRRRPPVEGRHIVDPDLPDSWPEILTKEVSRRATDLKGTTQVTPDLEAGRGWVEPLLSGCLLRAYHSTRLLDHEVARIRSQGLRLLSANLLGDKIRSAFDNGNISAHERDHLLGGHVFAMGNADNRRDQICLTLSRRIFTSSPFGVELLLSVWGGEGMREPHNEHLLRSLGRPAIIVAHLDLTIPGHHFFFPRLENVFVGALLGLRDVGADVFFRSPIPADRVEAIWQPGSPGYDVFERLPRD